MIMRNSLCILFILLTSSVLAQLKQRNNWEIGVGVAVVKFSDENAAFIGDKNLFQIPRLNLTAPLTDNLSFDGGLSFNTFDVGFIKNSVKYFSMDGSLRYNFRNLSEKITPYVFVGASLVDSELKMTPTFNVGAGATYWITEKLGINSQLYYKHSLESFESMRSHIQITAGVVFAFDAGRIFSGRGSSAVGGACYHNPNH